jgi:Rad3-related DNA helicase
MYVIKDRTIKISVRSLVEFICRSGDIDNRTGGMSDVKLMQEGVRLHKKIQKSMGAAYNAEVPLKLEIPIEDEGLTYSIKLEGRADGIICDLNEDEDGTKTPLSSVIIDEIKTVQTDVTKMKEPIYVHKAQAMCYGYIYALQNDLAQISVQMTYCNPETEAIQRFKEDYTFDAIRKWFNNLLDSFQRFSDYLFCERDLRMNSIHNLAFPFPYRSGQKDLVVSVYRAIEKEKNLYIQAPTGVGKTISTVFPAVQAMGQDYVEKIFYLTSKTITRTVAEDTFQILRHHGLHFRSITLTAKDKICHLEERNCNPDDCPYAKGHFDRINDAVYDIITHEEFINREKVMEYSMKHNVCPFEMSLDISYWCDGIICDYNYVFDPNAALKRYFGDGGQGGDYVFLVDEAHNLVDRAREMYSAILVKEDFLKIKRLVKESDKKLYHSLERCNRELLEYKRLCDSYKVLDSLGTFPITLERCFSCMQAFLEKHKNHPDMDDILDFYFNLRHFLNMYDCAEEGYVKYTEHDEQGNFVMKLYCVDPSGNISRRLLQGKNTVFFSATLLPINYFKEMLSGNIEDYAVYAESSFDVYNRRVVIGKDVSSRYTRRNVGEFRKICSYIKLAVEAHQGKYMVFFPSYSYMQSVYEEFAQMCSCHVIVPGENDTEDDTIDGMNVVLQNNYMKEHEKEAFLNLFGELDCKGSLIGFCVMGGIFSEGIDLKEESLIGVIIVGTGLPMICRERNILREYFDQYEKDGYAYSYVYPGMNKVLQASGRVIRTNTDRGVILLLDDRFLKDEYIRLYPREWEKVYPVTLQNVSETISEFWN